MWDRFEGFYQSFSDGLAARWNPDFGRNKGQAWHEVAPSHALQHLDRHRRKYLVSITLFLASTLLAMLVLTEARSSRIQAWTFGSIAQDLTFHLEAGPADKFMSAPEGPYDLRTSYAHLPRFISHLTDRGFRVTAQARTSSRMHRLAAYGIYPTYHAKDQAGLTILADGGDLIYKNRFPNRVYTDFDSIPPIAVRTLLFIENRTLLDKDYPHRNPAVEWNRLGKAMMDKMLTTLGSNRSVPGGSTLATQLEKVRHSPEGMTDNVAEKGRQMLSATLRSYLDGQETLETQKRIVLNYVNAVPLAAISGFGEVIGLGDGMWSWYGMEFDEYNRLLRTPNYELSDEERAVRAETFTRVLSLFLAHRRPSYYLSTPEGRQKLDLLTDYYAKLLVTEGVISAELLPKTVQVSGDLRRAAPQHAGISFVERKAANAVRARLLNLLRINSTYDLDHFDLTVQTTFHREAQEAVTGVVQQLHDRSYIRQAGLEGHRLVSGDPAAVNYAITLYERTPEGNKLRIQTDNFDGPLNINEGTKLELGSTAKLRTLVNYLQIINDVYDAHVGMPAQELRQIHVPRRDVLTRWTIDYLMRNPEASLEQILAEAMERRYSASTGERFFTAGGLHTFSNFDGTHEGRVITVNEAFRHSVNLPFIRMMRDIVYHYAANLPGSPTDVLDNADDPRRQLYLSRFADKEGRHFLNQFYRKYQGLQGDALLREALRGRNATPLRAAWIFRAVRPEASVEEFLAFRNVTGDRDSPAARSETAAFRRAIVENMSWQDRGYVARVHPLEVWLVGYMYQHPDAPRIELMEASAAVRQEVYGWLFNHRSKRAQDNRIWQIIEEDAFIEVHRAWHKVGYPFATLVPSYATSIGTSADRPGSLAELVGIILNDGVRMPVSRIERLQFAENTPYETVLEREPATGVRVLSPELSAVVRDAMVDVVERGTARRVAGSMKTSTGEVLPVGAKTGTGDNRVRVYGSGGTLLDSRPLNRTSTLVFFIGDRFFGTITVFVSGREASRYGFTSSLPAQLLRHLSPHLQPLFDGPTPLARPDTAGATGDFEAAPVTSG